MPRDTRLQSQAAHDPLPHGGADAARERALPAGGDGSGADRRGGRDGREMNPPSSRITTGIAGEHFVAGELAKRGWIATLTAKNTQHVDVLAQRPASDTFAAVQVKTRTPAYRYAWRVGKPGPAGPRDFYVFVDVGASDERPRYWVVPAPRVVE